MGRALGRGLELLQPHLWDHSWLEAPELSACRSCFSAYEVGVSGQEEEVRPCTSTCDVREHVMNRKDGVAQSLRVPEGSAGWGKERWAVSAEGTLAGKECLAVCVIFSKRKANVELECF